MPAQNPLEGIDGDVRFHQIMPDLWVIDARRCSHQWVVYHETYSFCLVRHIAPPASVKWRYNHAVYVADPDHLTMVMQPGELHANVERSPAGDFIVVQVGDSLMRRVAEELGWPFRALNINHPHPGNSNPALVTALRRFQKDLCATLFDPRPEGGRCTCFTSVNRHLENLAGVVGAFIETCAENARRIVHPARGAAVVGKAIDYVHAHYGEPYNLPQLARAAGCKKFYLSHAFKQAMGCSPSEFQTRILVAKTCEALAASPNKPLELIAREVGWPGRHDACADAEKASLMIRHFRATLRVTPGEFRAGLRLMSLAERRRYATSVEATRVPRIQPRKAP